MDFVPLHAALGFKPIRQYDAEWLENVGLEGFRTWGNEELAGGLKKGCASTTKLLGRFEKAGQGGASRTIGAAKAKESGERIGPNRTICHTAVSKLAIDT